MAHPFRPPPLLVASPKGLFTFFLSFFFFKFVAALLTTKPRGLKALVDCSLKKKKNAASPAQYHTYIILDVWLAALEEEDPAGLVVSVLEALGRKKLGLGVLPRPPKKNYVHSPFKLVKILQKM